MATIKLGRTSSSSRLINYAEKRAEVQEGVNCPSEYAKAQMTATRELWGKTDGIQAHHVIQSFKPDEVTPEQANEIGQDLAKEVANGHECVIYTHTDKEHIHNHIVINSVNFENGMKYQAHGDKAIENVREASDRLCKERDLSVVQEKTAEMRYTQAEKGLIENNKFSWKDDIRDKVDTEKEHSKSYEDFKKNLTEKHGIEVLERGKNITFKHPDNDRKVRGSKLGNSYEKETLKHEFEKRKAREGERGQERGNTNLSNEQSRGSERVAEANQRFERPHEGLHQNEHGQIDSRENDVRRGNKQHQDHEQTGHDRNALDIDEARKALKQQHRNVAKGFNRFTTRDEQEQQPSASTNEPSKQGNQRQIERDKEHNKDRNGEHEQEKSKQLKRTISKDIDDGPER